MSQIEVRFGGKLPGGVSASLEVPLEVLSADFERIAMGGLPMSGQPVQLDVPIGGPVVVRALLPSGEFVSATVAVPTGEAGERSATVLRLERTGGPSSRAPRRTTLRSGQPASGASGLRSLWMGGPLLEDEAQLSEAAITGVYRPGKPLQTGADLQWRYETATTVILEPAPQETTDESLFDSYRLRRAGANGEEPDDSTEEIEPLLLKVDGHPAAGAREAGAAALSWAVSVPPGSPLDISLVRAAGPDRLFELQLSGGDPRGEALLGYLRQGAFRHAAAIGEPLVQEVEVGLRNGVPDPNVAVAVGYYLLQTGRLSEAGWTEDLADAFDSISDGAVFHAWAVLGRPTPDLKELARRLRQAVRRGLPIYTTGLRRLYDALSWMVDQGGELGEELSDDLAITRGAATRADWEALFTTIRLDRASALLLEGEPLGLPPPVPGAPLQ
jgi:hypothetical protein